MWKVGDSLLKDQARLTPPITLSADLTTQADHCQSLIHCADPTNNKCNFRNYILLGESDRTTQHDNLEDLQEILVEKYFETKDVLFTEVADRLLESFEQCPDIQQLSYSGRLALNLNVHSLIAHRRHH